MNKKIYYSCKNIIKTNPQYAIIFGERSNGKSYNVAKYCLEKAYNDNELFVYLRRWELETKPKIVRKYFVDKPIKEITNGEYDTIDVYGDIIYFAKTTDSGKIKRGKQAGSVMYLGGATHYKSMSYLNHHYIIFEEFVTKSYYLPDEPTLLFDVVSTVARDNAIVVFMIGNTVSRLCPYFDEWQLTRIPRQKQGTIDVYERYTPDGEGIVRIAVEYCKQTGYSNKMFFGQRAKMIHSGAWEAENHHKLPPGIKFNACDVLYDLFIENLNMIYRVCVLYHNSMGTILYVYPTKQTLDYNNGRIITDKLYEFTNNIGISDKFIVMTKGDELIVDLLKKGRVAFSDNLTGTEFYQFMKGVF